MKKIHALRVKIYLILLLIFLGVINKMNAQTYVTIPDSGFVQYLQQNFSSCMNGGKLDISCAAVKNAPRIIIPNTFVIHNLFGVQYFTNLINLECMDNEITSLPELPFFLDTLRCDNNKITCLPYIPPNLRFLYGDGNFFHCVPNHSPNLFFPYPVCRDGDTINNPYNCPHEKGFLGNVFKDENRNCIKDAAEVAVSNACFKLFDDANNLIAKSFSYYDGVYQLIAPTGKYRVVLDTTEMPFITECFVDTMVILTDSLPNINNINFGILCKVKYDMGVQSIINQGLVFPGEPHRLIVVAGDLGVLNNLKCANAVSGQVKITVKGPVTYTGIPAGALTPSISGKIFTYTIANFDSVNIFKAFNLLFKTDTTATATDNICIEVEVIVGNDDVNINNNKKYFCYRIVNSYDPNLKEVFPFDNVKESYVDWFTYTIHFQNTGNAPAINIRLTDTLDKNLDLETLEILNSSHDKKVKLTGNALEIKFPNIQLADSASDEKNSKGFLQYRIKPKANLLSGTTIANRTFIYFDYNAPIITNTTLNHYVKTVSIPKNNNILPINIYPNPGNGIFFIAFDSKVSNERLTVVVYNILGSVVFYEKNMAASMPIDLSKEPNGVYSIKITGANQIFNSSLIKK